MQIADMRRRIDQIERDKTIMKKFAGGVATRYFVSPETEQELRHLRERLARAERGR